jgi:hypothetical protein
LREAQIDLEFCEMNIDLLENNLKKLMEIANSQSSDKDSVKAKPC